MNKFLGFGVAVVLCMAAAGFGAYLALRPEPATVPAAVVDASGSPAAQAPAAAVAAASPVQASAPASAVSPAPVPVTPDAPGTQPGRSARPASASAPKTGSVAGGASTVPPASAGAASADGAATGGNVSAGAPPDAAPVPPPVSDPVAPQPPPPPQKTYEELVVSADSVIGLRIESTVSSEVARVEDPVEARVTRDVRVGEEVAIPAGSRVLGSVIQVDRGGKMKNAARIGVRFHTLVLPDGNRLSMHTDAIYREGKSPGQESAAKVGGAAVGGAILGAIIGGGKGAAIGGSIGAAGGSAAVMAGGRNPAVLSSGTSLTIRLSQPVTVVVEKEELRIQ
jgi:hypothetical protein